jgi:two-component system, chemotaxis family, CheB/CheR fusion protein
MDNKESTISGPNQAVNSRADKKGFPVIGIGASAGGLDAFNSLFKSMPVDTGMAFILIQHIEPSHIGNMVGLIQRQTRMPVVEVKDDGLKVQPNHLYMIPQNREISMIDGMLKLGAEIDSRSMHSIDLFFRSLANDLGDHAICIILSGTGIDGTAGARAVKAETGLVIVQDPGEASYDGMPRSAIDAGVADFVLPADRVAEKLIEYVKGRMGNRRRDEGKLLKNLPICSVKYSVSSNQKPNATSPATKSPLSKGASSGAWL